MPRQSHGSLRALAYVTLFAVQGCTNNNIATETANRQPIENGPGTTQSLKQFCSSKPSPKIPNGQQTLDAICAPSFVAKYPATTIKTFDAANLSVIEFGKELKVDEVCGPSGFKAPTCRGFRPGDLMKAMPAIY